MAAKIFIHICQKEKRKYCKLNWDDIKHDLTAEIMKADWLHSPTRKRTSSLGTYRYNRIKWRMKKIVSEEVKRQKTVLSGNMDKYYSVCSDMYDRECSGFLTQDFLDSYPLSPLEKRVLVERYLQRETVPDIAHRIGVSTTHVHNLTQKAILKIQKIHASRRNRGVAED